jgi:hypothetical protein
LNCRASKDAWTTWLSIPPGRSWFIAALANNTVEVIDTRAGTHLQSLKGFREPTGIASVHDAGSIAVANGQGDGVRTMNAIDYRVIKEIPLGDDSDNVRYDAGAKTLYVGYGGGALAAVRPADGAVSGRATLAGHPESFQLESSGPRVFVNVPAAGHIAVVDRGAMKVVATWPVTGAAANFPMALDEAGHRLFVGCRRPAKLLVYDTATGKQTGAVDIVGDTDDLFYDAARKRVYVSGGDGFIDVLDARPAATPARSRAPPRLPGRAPRSSWPNSRGCIWRCRTGAANAPRSVSTTCATDAASLRGVCAQGLRLREGVRAESTDRTTGTALRRGSGLDPAARGRRSTRAAIHRSRGRGWQPRARQTCRP